MSKVKFLFAFILIFLVFSCSKESENSENQNTITSYSIEINNGSYPLPVDSIVNPEPIVENNREVLYSFPLSDDESNRLIIRHSFFNQETDSTLLNSQSIEVEVEWVTSETNTVQVTNSSSLNNDSTFIISAFSSFNPLASLNWINNVDNVYPKDFENGDQIDLEDVAINWISDDEGKMGLSGNGIFLFKHDFAIDSLSSGFTLTDQYYPYWNEVSNKWFVFRWSENDVFKYGWAQLSFSNNELKVHKVIYQR